MYYLPVILFASLVLILIPFVLYFCGMIIFALCGDIVIRHRKIREMMEDDEHDRV